MKVSTRCSLVWVASVALGGWCTLAHAQDTTPASGEPLTDTDPATLTYDYLVDGSLTADDPDNRTFTTLQAAYAAAPEGTAQAPTVIGIRPNVYLIPGGDTGASLTLTKSYITLLGLTNNRRSVVLADNRGNRQGANGNGFVLDVDATGFTVKNLTILNYCNADYEYPGDASKNLTKRSDVITQAVALQAQGDKHVYENVALLSRLDTMFLRTTRSYFKDVFIEGTDDFIGGGAVSAWENCEIIFPTGSGVMSASNVAFLRSTFRASNAMQFSKSGAQGVALIDTILPGTGTRVSWVEGEAPPRPVRNYVTYRVKDEAGAAVTVSDGSAGAATFEYSWELSDEQAQAFNPWNLLRATPTGQADDWDPAGAREMYESAGQGSLIYRMALTGTPAEVRTGAPGVTIGATVAPLRADQTITWSTTSSSVTLSRTMGPDVVVTGNTTGEPEYVPIVATAANGFHATAWVYVEPAYVEPPVLGSGPTLSPPTAGQLSVEYAYDLGDKQDQSLITWSICDDASCANSRDVAVSRDNEPLKTYTLTPGDVGKFVRVGIAPKHNVSDPGPAVFATTARAIEACDLSSTGVSPNFRNFVTTTNDSYVSGLWTVLGTWTAEPGPALVNGYGLRVASQGAALLYQEDTPRGDMRVALTMTPEKTSGAGFGSPGSGDDGDRVQKSDIYIKYDPRTKNGYSLRYWRTTQSTSQVMFQFYKIENGVGSPLSDMQLLSGVFKPNTELVLTATGDRLAVAASNTRDAQQLALEATITPNDFGGAGVAWWGTVPSGNSNVYSRIEISYPGTENTCGAVPGDADPSASGSGGGCALPRHLEARHLVLGVLLGLGAFAMRRQARRKKLNR
jgi:hypothetical protein